MGYKHMDQHLTFAEIDLLNSLEHNRAINRLNHINMVIDWSRIDRLLLKHYCVGKSNQGADAYLPLLLLKCLLLQQWFHIDSDPELETQINDRISFKKFLGLSFDQRSPDHSTFCRFRGRLSKTAMQEINHEVLAQFASHGVTINEGVAIDARLVQSASRPISTEKLAEEREKRETPEARSIRTVTSLSSPAIWIPTGQ